MARRPRFLGMQPQDQSSRPGDGNAVRREDGIPGRARTSRRKEDKAARTAFLTVVEVVKWQRENPKKPFRNLSG